MPTKPGRSLSQGAVAEGWRWLPAVGEERGQEGGGGVRGDAGDHLDLCRKAGITNHIPLTAGSPRLGVPGADHQPGDAGCEDCARAHEARLERDHQRVALEVPRPGLGRGLPQRQNFGVCRRVCVDLTAVVPTADDDARRVDDDRADGNVVVLQGSPGLGERLSHCRGIVHGRHASPLGAHDDCWGARGSGTVMPMDLHVANHPLIDHKVTVLRDQTTPSPTFRRLVDELVTLLAYEATRHVRVEQRAVVTPLTTTTGTRIADPAPLIVPILRAGLGMLDGMTRLLPSAEVGFLGLKRDEETLEAVTYANRLPEDLTGRQVFILDPMLATGGSLIAAIDYVLDRGATDVTCVCLLAAPEGIDHVRAHVGDRDGVNIVVACVDEKLNEVGYIVPGLGDAGDRLYGVV